MKIRNVTFNNRKREFTLRLRSGVDYSFPYAKAAPAPVGGDGVREVFVDKELGSEAFTYLLESGKEGSVHVEQALEFHEDPDYMTRLLLYKLSLEAQRRVDESGLSRRQIIARLRTSAGQLYRLLDPANTNKSMNRLIALLRVLGCDVDLVVNGKPVA